MHSYSLRDDKVLRKITVDPTLALTRQHKKKMFVFVLRDVAELCSQSIIHTGWLLLDLD